jgi:hypothetical protein
VTMTVADLQGVTRDELATRQMGAAVIRLRHCEFELAACFTELGKALDAMKAVGVESHVTMTAPVAEAWAAFRAKQLVHAERRAA